MSNFEGQLSKFTNVVKGWQYRWFIVDGINLTISYFLMEDKSGKYRARQSLEDALITPSDEDGCSFCIYFNNGESWRLRTNQPQDRETWVEKLKECCCYIGQRRSSSVRKSSRSIRSSSKSSSSLYEYFQKPVTRPRDAFNAVEDMIVNLDSRHFEISKAIESLPSSTSSSNASPEDEVAPSCHSKNLLLIKATSCATVQCLDEAFSMLKDLANFKDTQIKLKNTGN